MQALTKLQPSGIALLAANLVPLVGVLAFGWRVFDIMVIYWSENVFIGLINVLKMICCAYVPKRPTPGNNDAASPKTRMADRLAALPSLTSSGLLPAKLFLVPFFTVHYGIFCLVHGVFVFVLFGNEWSFGDTDSAPELFRSGELHLQPAILIAVLTLGASHLFSFAKNYLFGGEYLRTSLLDLMVQPYGRVIVLHVAILAGGFATMFLGSHVVSLLILIAGKTLIDLKFHLAQHRKTSNGNSAT